MVSDSDQQKLEALSARISKAQKEANPSRRREGESLGAHSSIVRAMRIGSDFVAMVIVPTVLGGFLDDQLKTGPWIMLSMVFVGFIGGFYSLVHTLDEGRRKGQDGSDAKKE